MNASDIAALARAARKAGCGTLLQLQIAGELLTRGEATLISLANSTGTTLEAIAHSAAGMESAGGVKVVTCREAVGFTIARLTSPATEAFKAILTASTPPLRSKKIPL